MSEADLGSVSAQAAASPAMPPPKMTTRTGRSAARVQSDPCDPRALLVDHLAPVDVTLDLLGARLVDAAVDQHLTWTARTLLREGDDPAVERPAEALADQVPSDQARHAATDTSHADQVAFVADDGPVLAAPGLQQRHHPGSPEVDELPERRAPHRRQVTRPEPDQLLVTHDRPRDRQQPSRNRRSGGRCWRWSRNGPPSPVPWPAGR